MNEDIKHKLYALADALEIDLSLTETGFEGTTKRVLEIFEGYSPTIITSIEHSLIDSTNDVVGAAGQIWGNVGFVLVVEHIKSRISFFIYDRAKADKGMLPFQPDQWSRKQLYFWLKDCCKAIYHRSMFDIQWQRVNQGPLRLREYDEERQKGATAKEAYNLVWGDA